VHYVIGDAVAHWHAQPTVPSTLDMPIEMAQT